MMGHKICFHGVTWLIIPKIILFTPSYLEHCFKYVNILGGLKMVEMFIIDMKMDSN